MSDHPLGPAAPIVRVASVRASLAYYVDKLGFKLDWDEGGIAAVSRGPCNIFLCEWNQGQKGTWMWVSGDVDALHEELTARGAKIRHPPTNYAWAYEMQVEDLDGNVLRIGGEPKHGQPFGPFLDAAGVLWETNGA